MAEVTEKELNEMSILPSDIALTKEFVKKGSVRIFEAHNKSEMLDEQRNESLYVPDIVVALAKLQDKDGIFHITRDDENAPLNVSINNKVKLDTKASKFIQELNETIKEFNDDENISVLIYNNDKFNEYRANQNGKPMSKQQALSEFLSSEFSKQVSKTVSSIVADGTAKDSPFSLSDRTGVSVENLRGTGQVSVVVISDFDKDLTKEGLMVRAPGAKRLIEEQEISDERLRTIVASHEIHHAFDDTDYTKYTGIEGKSVLGELYKRHRMEAKADIGAAIQSYKKYGDLKSSKYWEFMRANFVYEAVRSRTIMNAALMGQIPGVYDKKSMDIACASKDLAEKLEKEVKEGGPIEKTFDNLQKNAESFSAIANLGMTAAYDTAPLLDKFHKMLKGDKKLQKDIMGMKQKDVNKLIDTFLEKEDMTKEQFGQYIVSMAQTGIGENGMMMAPNDPNLMNVFKNKQRLDKVMGVSMEENYAFEDKENEKIFKYVNKMIHSSVDGFFFDKSNKKEAMTDSKYSNLNKWMDTLTRKIERETINQNGNETAGFGRVITSEIDSLREHKQRYSKEKLEIVENYFLGNKKEVDLRIASDKQVRKDIENMKSFDISDFKGEELVSVYIENQLAKLDLAEQGLAKLKKGNEKGLSPKAMRERAESLEVVYGDIISYERLAQDLSSKMSKDKEAKKTIGDSSIIKSKVTIKSGGKFPHWVRDFLITMNEGAPEWRVDTLLSRIDEKRKLLAKEVYNNKPLLKSLGDYGESLQKRIISLNNFYEVDEINKKSLEKGNNDLNVGKAAVTKYEEIKPLTNDVKKIKVPDAYQAKFFEKANAR